MGLSPDRRGGVDGARTRMRIVTGSKLNHKTSTTAIAITTMKPQADINKKMTPQHQIQPTNHHQHQHQLQPT
jgi:hypothetical protein